MRRRRSRREVLEVRGVIMIDSCSPYIICCIFFFFLAVVLLVFGHISFYYFGIIFELMDFKSKKSM